MYNPYNPYKPYFGPMRPWRAMCEMQRDDCMRCPLELGRDACYAELNFVNADRLARFWHEETTDEKSDNCNQQTDPS